MSAALQQGPREAAAEILALTLWGEAAERPVRAIEALAALVVNRARQAAIPGGPAHWGRGVAAVCRAPFQFPCCLRNLASWRRMVSHEAAKTRVIASKTPMACRSLFHLVAIQSTIWLWTKSWTRIAMPKQNVLTVREIAALIRAGRPGATSDGAGLSLRVAGPGSARWTLRYQRDGRARETGLGGVAVQGDRLTGVSLAEARQKADHVRAMLREGLDPIAEAEKAKPAAIVTFADVLETVMVDKVSSNRSERHRAQWRATLSRYADGLMTMPVEDIGTDDVLAVLRPIWTRVPETASRVRQRIEAVLTAATVRGLRHGQNPAQWRTHLQGVLPAPRKVKPTENHPALAWQQMPAFWSALVERKAKSTIALQFLILTAARTGEVRGMRRHEVDLDAATWTVPAGRMKAGKQHRVALSEPAVAILRKRITTDTGVMDLLFPGVHPSRLMSDWTMRKALDAMNVPETDADGAPPCWRDDRDRPIAPHGFRATFRMWCAEAGVSDAVAEAALAHVVRGVQGAYQRSDLIEQRRVVMQRWAAHCLGQGAKIVMLKPRKGRA